MHITVLLNEAIENLKISKNKIYVDATSGAGGHSSLILEKLNDTGHLFCFDQDMVAINILAEKFKNNKNCTIIRSNFSNLKEKLLEKNVNKVDGILFDLGLSSMQIDNKERGFSYMQDAEIDMRMSDEITLSAKDILNTYTIKELADIFFRYGEEKNSFKIANEIVKNRPINNTFDLVDICDKINYKSKGHSSKKVFQALRIYVNNELGVLEKCLNEITDLINPGGRIVIITFHSLEYEMVIRFFKKVSRVPIIKDIPIAFEEKPKFKLITKNPILPSDFEIKNNIRSHSAKMLVIEKN